MKKSNADNYDTKELDKKFSMMSRECASKPEKKKTKKEIKK